ncbi:MAG: SAVED domain-containing protein [Anaerolineae bacterium]|nr:SAVED domain-containing protein [Anaerolineae bacterium]
MASKEQIQKLIFNNNRRLQVLKEQQSLKGYNVAPETVLEIEDIEASIQSLQTQLTELIFEEVRADAPLVHLYTFGQPPAKVPEQAIVLDWRDKFEVTPPRTIPSPELWQSDLVPKILDLPNQVDGPGLIRLYGLGALSVAFTFGSAFREVGRYLLEVEQFFAGKSHFWYSDETPPGGQMAPEFVPHYLAGNPAATDGAVIVYAAPKQSLAEITASVGRYWGEADIFKAALDGTGASEKLKGVLVLEAEMASKKKQGLQSWEAAVLARQSGRPLADFINQTKPEKLHLFLAVPFGLAVFLGHQWNALNKKVQCYEWIGGDTIYAPAGELQF